MSALPPPPEALKVGGLTPFTSIDYPGQLAAVVFVQGCPWRCAYCHNPHLQPRDAVHAAPVRGWREVRDWLERRAGLIDAVVFSGGEPTIDAGLGAAMADVRALGLSVGLHTAGIYPRRLAEVLCAVDWVGFDVKAPLSQPQTLDRVVGLKTSTPAVRESLLAVMASGVSFECRTTAHEQWLDDEALLQIARELTSLGVARYALQIARAADALGAAAPGYPAPATIAEMSRLFPSFVARR